MRYKVIFDTNLIRSEKSLNDFLGNREEVKKFLQTSEIIIPGMVIDEIKSQKRNYLLSQKNAFLKNPFISLANISEEEIKNFDIDNRIFEIFENEKIPYTKISLIRESALEDIKELCLKNSPPFGESGDRGFKDAYIYLTILDYLKNPAEEVVYFVTTDAKLKEAFKGNRQVIIIANHEEFEKYTDGYFRENYFIEKLKLLLDASIEKKDITKTWLNSNNDWILQINHNENIWFVEVDFTTREIYDYIDYDYSKLISNLIHSGSFRQTHDCIAELRESKKFFNNKEIHDLIIASIENMQIIMISMDDDVNNFFHDLYERNKIPLNKESGEGFIDIFSSPL